VSIRRRTTVILALLMGSALVPVAGAPPAGAAEGCVRDVSVTVFSLDGCDDTTPPDTSFGATAPRMTATGWINKRTLRVAIVGAHTDADTDPIRLQCRLSLDPGVPAEDEWTDCPGDGVFGNLAESASKPYVLWARAVDTADNATLWDDSVNSPFTIGDETAPDVDASPARLSFSVDTLVPNTYLLNTPYDELRPELPMVTTPTPHVRLASNEASSFVCTLNGSPVSCGAGQLTLRPGPGDHTLRVQAVDQAGNADPTPASTAFAVPANLKTKAKGWKRVVNGDFFGGDYLVSRTRGAVFGFTPGKYRELRLLASTGPSAGVIEVKVGEAWRRVSLKRSTRTRADQIQILDEFAPRRGGKVWVRVVSNNKPVVLDGVLAH
jgi:hypothetical protein